MVSVLPSKLRVLIVSRSAPDPGHGSGLHMEDFAQALEAEGCEIHYLALVQPSPAEPSRSAIRRVHFLEAQEGANRDWDACAQDWECQAVNRICRLVAPHAVVADYSWMGGIFAGGYFRENPTVKTLIFVHDLRVRIMPSLVRMGLLKSEENRWTREREAGLLAEAGALLTLNEQDQRMAAALAPKARVLRMGMSVRAQPPASAAPVSGRCLYVASGTHENLFASMWLLKCTWPLVVAAQPSASLVICGGVGDLIKSVAASGHDWLADLGSLNVWIEGRVGDLAPYYASAQIALVPHWMDGGIKIKHIEALAYGLAVVCTPAGADGLPQAVGRSAFVAEMPEEFGGQVIRLLGDPAALEAARGHARGLARRLTPGSVYREVLDFLPGPGP